MFSSFMTNAWMGGTIVAVLAGAVGFFVVLRGASFAAHAIPNGAFAGAAGAKLVGVAPLFGLVSFAMLAALASGRQSPARNDVATALSLVLMLALGAAFLTLSTDYEPAINALLFGEILGVCASQYCRCWCWGYCASPAFRVLSTAGLHVGRAGVGRAKGINATLVEICFLLVLAFRPH